MLHGHASKPELWLPLCSRHNKSQMTTCDQATKWLHDKKMKESFRFMWISLATNMDPYSTSQYNNKCSSIISWKGNHWRVNLSRQMLHLLFPSVPCDILFSIVHSIIFTGVFFEVLKVTLRIDVWMGSLAVINCYRIVRPFLLEPLSSEAFVWVYLGKTREERCWFASAWWMILFTSRLMMKLNIQGPDTSGYSRVLISVVPTFKCWWQIE